MRVTGLVVMACGVLAACSPAPADTPEAEADVPQTNVALAGPLAAEASAAPAAIAPGPGADLREWLVGTWSFDEFCGSSDFAIQYREDGGLDNSGQIGRWRLDGDRVTETITESVGEDGESSAALEGAQTRSYAIQRIDGGHGAILFEGRRIPILRC